MMKLFALAIAALFCLTFYQNGAKTVFDPFGKCVVSKHTFYSEKDKDFFIKSSLYSLNNKKSNKTILLLPPTGGENILDVGYAYSLCKEGFNVFSLREWSKERGKKDYALDLNVHQRYMTRTQKAIELSLKHINEKKIGVLGTSSGAINFSVALGSTNVSSKVKAFFNIVGGAPLCDIIARAGESALSDVREKRFKVFRFKNESEYIDTICSKVTWTIPKTKPTNTEFAMVLASQDTTVPYDLQEKLRSWWKPKEVKTQPHGHLFAIVKTFFTEKKRIIDFFKGSLD